MRYIFGAILLLGWVIDDVNAVRGQQIRRRDTMQNKYKRRAAKDESGDMKSGETKGATTKSKNSAKMPKDGSTPEMGPDSEDMGLEQNDSEELPTAKDSKEEEDSESPAAKEGDSKEGDSKGGDAKNGEDPLPDSEEMPLFDSEDVFTEILPESLPTDKPDQEVGVELVERKSREIIFASISQFRLRILIFCFHINL